MAGSRRDAENFVNVMLRDSVRRLNYIDGPQRLYGRQELVIHVHPTAKRHRDYADKMEIARRQGCIFLLVDDSYSRERYYHEQMLRMRELELKTTLNEGSRVLTGRLLPDWKIDP
jgi:hypothetical protein